MTPTLAGTDRLTIVKLLADGRDPDFVATATTHTRETVLRVGSEHGYPDTTKLAWAADILTKQATDPIPPAEHTRPADLIQRRPGSPRPAPQSITRPPGTLSAATPAPEPAASAPIVVSTNGAPDLITLGKKSTRARTRTLAERAEKALAVLAKELDTEIARNREAARRAAEEAKVRADVARLEAELAAKKALLSKSRAAKGSAATRAGTDPKAVRAWARDAGVECPPVGRVPNRVVDAYLAAQNGAAA